MQAETAVRHKRGERWGRQEARLAKLKQTWQADQMDCLTEVYLSYTADVTGGNQHRNRTSASAM